MTRVASIQLPFEYAPTPQDFADRVRVPVERAADDGADLVLLPHAAAFMLFGMFDADARPDESVDELARRQGADPRAWLLSRADYVFEFYLHLFQSLAARVGRWLSPGSVLEPQGDAFYLTAFLFNPAGETTGRQRQMHPRPEQLAWGVRPGNTARMYDTEVGALAFVIGDDVRYPEVALGVAAGGAQVLLHPAAGTAADVHDASSRALWQLAQTAPAFGVQANLVGGAYRGHSAVFAPSELTPDRSGILARAASLTDGQVILADLDLDALAALRRRREINKE